LTQLLNRAARVQQRAPNLILRCARARRLLQLRGSVSLDLQQPGALLRVRTRLLRGRRLHDRADCRDQRDHHDQRANAVLEHVDWPG